MSEWMLGWIKAQSRSGLGLEMLYIKQTSFHLEFLPSDCHVGWVPACCSDFFWIQS